MTRIAMGFIIVLQNAKLFAKFKTKDQKNSVIQGSDIWHRNCSIKYGKNSKKEVVK